MKVVKNSVPESLADAEMVWIVIKLSEINSRHRLVYLFLFLVSKTVSISTTLREPGCFNIGRYRTNVNVTLRVRQFNVMLSKGFF
jgi:hypothetical protein